MSVWMIFAAGAIYLLAHLVRAARLYVLSLGSKGDAKNLVLVHLVTALPASMMPFFSGEVLRVSGFTAVSTPKIKGGIIWSIERFGDAISILLFLMLLTSIVPIENTQFIVLALFVFLSLLLLGAAFALEGIPFMRNYLVTKSVSTIGMKVLPVVVFVDETVSELRDALSGRVSAIIILSLLVWLCEFTSILLSGYVISGNLFGETNIQDILLEPSFAGYRYIVLCGLMIIGGVLLVRKFLKSGLAGNG